MSELNEAILGLKQGEDDAFSFIYNLFEKSLYNHLYRMLGSESRAEEIFQETMLSLIKKIDLYSHRDDLQNSFKSWIFRIATNLAIDEIRKNKSVSPLEENYSITEKNKIEIHDTEQRIHFLIGKLPLMQRTFLGLRVKEDLSIKEIAVICKVEVNAVKQGLFRGRKALKDLLIEEGIVL